MKDSFWNGLYGKLEKKPPKRLRVIQRHNLAQLSPANPSSSHFEWAIIKASRAETTWRMAHEQ
jgi:hypothetical protein